MRYPLWSFDATDGGIFLYYSLNTHKLDAGARKSRKFEGIFRPGRRHSKPMQNLRVQSTAENLIGFVSLPGQKLSSNLLFIDSSEHRNP